MTDYAVEEPLGIINLWNVVGKMMIRSNSLVIVAGWSIARGFEFLKKVHRNDAATQQL